jgi:hypothetical protein
VSTELSIGINLDGKETEVPSLVPTLSQAEIDHLLGGGEPTQAIIQKAADYARSRLAEGKSPFASDDESPASEWDVVDESGPHDALIAQYHAGELPDRKKSIVEELAKRGAIALDQFKSGARSVVEGATSLPLMVGDAANTLINYGISGANELTGANIPELGMPSETTKQMLDATGAQEDTGITGDIIRGAAGAMTFPAGAAVSSPVSTAGTALKTAFAAKPIAQVVSGAGSGAGSGLVREAGGGPGAQMVGSLVGGMAPYAAKQTPAAFRSGVTGKRGPEGVAENIKTFGEANTTPSVGQATQGRAAQAAESFLSRSPGSAGVIADKATTQSDDIARMIEEIAGKSGGKAQTGKAIKEGVADFVTRFKEKSGELYGLVDGVISPKQKVPVNNTISTLRNLTSRIKGATKTSEEFINPKLARIKQNLIQDTGETIKARRDAVKSTMDQMTKIQGQIDDIERRIIDQASAEETVAQRLGGKMNTGKRDSLAIKELTEKKEALTNRLSSELPEMLKDDLAELVKGRQMPYQAMKELRTRIGYMLDSSELMSDIPKSELNKLYGAISRDIESGLPEEARPLLANATKFYKQGRDRIDILENVLSGKTYEKIYNAAIGEVKDGPTLISEILSSMPRSTRRKMAHEFLRTMGKSTAGKQNAAVDAFSTETFLTNWGKMDSKAKTALFSNISPDYIKSIDSIAKVAENIRAGSKVFSNPSGTQQAVSLRETIGGVMVALLTGHPGAAAAGMAEPAIAYGAAKWMTNPNIVKWLAQNNRRPVERLPILINSLARQHRNDAEVQDFAETIQGEK